jgi:hypothetical protein
VANNSVKKGKRRASIPILVLATTTQSRNNQTMVTRLHTKFAVLFLSLVAVSVVGCRHAKPPVASVISRDSGYLDLQLGWRLRVVTPILESGQYKVKTEEQQGDDGTINFQVGKGFLGYQTDYYSVKSRGDGRLIVAFQRGEFISPDQRKTNKSSPAVNLFDIANDTRWVRLLFLTRVSETDHDEAVLSSASRTDLDELTAEVESSPVANCKPQQDGLCSWVPQGIAVVVEKRSSDNARGWVPVL